MAFRVTTQLLFERNRFDMTAAYARLAQSQIEISSTKRLRVLSDDPSDAARALDLRVTLKRTAQSKDAVGSARRAADTQADVLQQVSELIAQARQLGQSAGDGIKNQADLDALADEIDSVLGQVVSAANTRLEGRYLFAGSKIGTRPFDDAKSYGSTTGVSYHGDDIVRRVRLGPKELQDVELSGADAFLGGKRGATILTGGSGLRTTPGAHDTMRGSATILLAHVATIVGDGAGPGGADTASGIKVGTSGAADTILGAKGQHALTLTSDGAGGGTIRLDDGDAIAFAGTETDLALHNAAGDLVHVDLTSLTSGFAGTVDLTGNGTIQVEGSAAQALAFTDDYLLKDAQGQAVHLDTRDLAHASTTLAVFPGTDTVFDALIALRDEIRGKPGFTQADLGTRLSARLNALDAAHDHILGGVATLGSRSAGFQRIEDSLDGFELSLEDKRGELEDTDLFEASLRLAESENAYQSALASAAKLTSGPSLLDYL